MFLPKRVHGRTSQCRQVAVASGGSGRQRWREAGAYFTLEGMEEVQRCFLVLEGECHSVWQPWDVLVRRRPELGLVMGCLEARGGLLELTWVPWDA